MTMIDVNAYISFSIIS